uniref:Cadherin domain-containing protein n=1 Tax=Denticeps clupeoides TaxID=299321 RepID=A0AAY4BD02_9TELE
MDLFTKRGHSGILFFVCLCLYKGLSAQIFYSVSEEVSPGTFVGNLAKDLNLKISELDARMLQIVKGKAKRHFDVDLNTGALFVTERIDREQLCSSSDSCTESLEAIVNNPLKMFSVLVKIVDINDNAPSFPGKSQIIKIAESALAGAKFSVLSAEDPDVGSNSIESYKLSPNPYFNLDVHHEADRGPSAELVLQKPLDREKQSVVNLILTAVDGGKPPKSGTTEIIINVLDANDNAPVFSKSVYKAQVNENVPVGTAVFTVTATDIDEDVNGAIVYSFKQGQKGIGDKFAINQSTGEIITTGTLDHEETSSYEIRVEAKDRSQTPLGSHCKVLVEVLDLNDNPPDIEISTLLDKVREDTTKGTAIALITVQDRDGGKNGQFKCAISGGSPFVLESSQGKYFSLILNEALDRETRSEYNITITATDEGAPPLSSTAAITVRISDVNDNAPRFPEPVMNAYLKENSPAGSSILTLSVNDFDAGENARVTFSLLDTSTSSAPTSAFFSVNPATGEIHSVQSFNHEEVKNINFQVQATDSGIPPLSSNVTVNVFILDENDNSPVVLPPYSEHGSVNTENIPYSAEAGYFVAKIRAVDGDSGYNALLSYHISEPKSTNLFRIGSSTGEVRTKRRMSDNDLRSHPLVIVVCDHGEPPLSATVSIDVVVSEMIDDAETTFRQVPVQEKNFSDLNLYLLIAIIAVSSIFLFSLIIFIVVKCHGTDGGFNKYGPPVVTTHPDGTWSYTKSTEQYDVCFSSDTLKSDGVVFPASFPPADMDLISINGGDTFQQTQTLPSTTKPKAPNADWRYSASLRAGVQSSVHMEESSVMQGAQGMLVQNWPTVSSAADGEGGELSPPSWRRNQQQQLALPLRASTRLRPPSGPEARGDSPRSLHYPRFPCHHFHSPRARHW